MSITNFINKEDINFGSRPVQRLPAGFAETVKLGFQATRDNFLTTSAGRLKDEEFGKRNREFERITGEVLKPELASNYEPFVEPNLSGTIRSGTKF